MSIPREERLPSSSTGRYRRSPVEVNPLGGTYANSQGGRPFLPSLTARFPTSSLIGYQQPSYASRMSPIHDETLTSSYPLQGNWNSAPHFMASQQMYSNQLHEHDPRYIDSQGYPLYAPRQSTMPPSEPQASRRLPPPNTGLPQPQREGWGHHHYPTYVSNSTAQSGLSNGRSTLSGYHPYDYPAVHHSSYPSLVSGAPDPRHIPGQLPTSHEDHSGSHLPMHGDWSNSGSMRINTHGMPYSRSPDNLSSARSSHPPTSPVDFPVTKKKRKRADAAQLKVLNDVYSRTAFPTTEERQDLARKLDMTARSVQIWFQNKRQASRQSRTATNALPPLMHHPYTNAPLQSMAHPGGHGAGSASGNAGYGEVSVTSSNLPSDPYYSGRGSVDPNGRSKRRGPY